MQAMWQFEPIPCVLGIGHVVPRSSPAHAGKPPVETVQLASGISSNNTANVRVRRRTEAIVAES
jgi:hypothetical protein